MPRRPKTPEKNPEITASHFEMLARKREKWAKDYSLVKYAKEKTREQVFYQQYFYWDEVKASMPELCRLIIELYYGLGTPRLTTTQIGEELPINGKPRTRQAIHLMLQKGLDILDSKNPY